MTFGMTMMTLDFGWTSASTRWSRCCSLNQANERGTRSRPSWWCSIDSLGTRV